MAAKELDIREDIPAREKSQTRKYKTLVVNKQKQTNTKKPKKRKLA